MQEISFRRSNTYLLCKFGMVKDMNARRKILLAKKIRIYNSLRKLNKPRGGNFAKKMKAKMALIAYDMRIQGRTYRQISKALNISETAAYNCVKNCVLNNDTKLREKAEELRRIELERLDQMYRALMPRIKWGDPNAIEKGLKIMQQRGKYVPDLTEPDKLRLGEDPEAPFQFELAQQECMEVLKSLAPKKEDKEDE
jgi:hypothetical protein